MAKRKGSEASIAWVGLRRRHLADLYHSLLVSSWPRLLALIVGLYGLANVLFAAAYRAGGDCIENARPGSFEDAFFFSVQTLATLGYGKLAPRTTYANAIAAVESVTSLLAFAMVTGLLFAKFSRPTARVVFSRVAVVTNHNGAPHLMFRMANERSNRIVEAQLHVVLVRDERTAEGESIRRFYDLALARSQTAMFALTWTAMHPIDATSPLRGHTAESLAAASVELVVSLTGLDDSFSQTVHARHGYRASEILWDRRFVDILSRLPDGRRQIDYRRFHDVGG